MAYATRTMRAEEVRLALDWAAAEGWNPGLHDAQVFRSADPEGFFVGVLDGTPVASLSVVRYGAIFAFLGLYIVLPAFRGRGLGWALWQHGMRSAGPRQVGLDGVVAQQDNYRKSGFELAWRNVRYEGRGLGRQQTRSVPLAGVPLDTVLAHDRAFFPADRGAFLRAWLTQADASAYGFLEGGELRGYGLIRRCLAGWKIGPLFADSEAIAEDLFTALAAQATPQERIYLDVPEPNAAALALAHRHGLQPVFETARMYTGAAPATPLHRTYGITSFELG